MSASPENNNPEQQPFNSRYATRERIVRQYAAEDAQRARNARLHSQNTAESYKESAARAKERARQRERMEARRREEDAMQAAQRAAQREKEAAMARTKANAREHAGRSVLPLSSQESRERARLSQESYERARAMRDALSIEHQNRSPNRDLIDARGSVDSRAFSENDELIGYAINKGDRPSPYVENHGGKGDSHWRSSGSGAGIAGTGRSSRQRNYASRGQGRKVRGGNQFGQKSGLPTFVKVVVPIIIILAIILYLMLR